MIRPSLCAGIKRLRRFVSAVLEPHPYGVTRKSSLSNLLLTLSILVATSLTGSGVASPRFPRGRTNPKLTVAEHIQRIENGLAPIPIGKNEPPLQLSLQQMMELYKVPGLSVAVIDDYKIAWAKGYGVRAPGSTTPVTPDTLFQAGSVSKPVAATAALYLVQQGKLALDEDVNLKLKSWKVPENEFTKQEKVTLRRILSHTAGLTVDSFPGYAVDASLPTLVQILNGEKPANTQPVRVALVPGSKWRYSGGGVTIEQLLMMDVTGKSFPQLLREIVFEKMRMNDSTFEQPLPANRAARAASAAHGDGTLVGGNWHVYPEMAAAGLWTTPSDLAKFAIEIAKSKQGRSNLVLSQATTREMLKAQIDHLGPLVLGDENHSDRMGLGFFLGDETRPDLFGHIGSTEGFRTVLFMFGDSGKGVVIMSNIDFGWPFPVTDYLVTSVAKEYGWNYSRPTSPAAGMALWTVAQLKGTPAAIQKYAEFKNGNSPDFLLDKNTLITLATGLYRVNKLQDAIEIMKLEVQEYPEYSDAFEALAQLSTLAGNKELAIRSYQRLVELNPGNQAAIDELKKLREHN